MAGVTTYSCTKCRPIDTEIIQAYLILSNTSKLVSEQEADRVTAENGRVDAEAERTRVFAADHGTASDDHTTAQADHRTAGDDHLIAVADHGIASDDHTRAESDHGTASGDHTAVTTATARANTAAAAAEHMVDIHQGPPGDDGKSAYEIAVEEGFVGTEEQWIASLKGRDGNPGSSQDYPFELVNNEETDDSTKAHTAQGAKRLKDEITQLEHEVHNLSGKYYGVFADESDLPDDAVTPGYAFVGAESPYAIWNFDGEEWSDSGSVANGITGEPGVGFSSIFTPGPYDGTVIIVLSNNDTITLDLNHSHPGYYPKVAESAQPSGGFLPDVAYKLGELTGSTLTFDLASPVSGNINHYFFVFSTGSTAPSTVNWPSSVTAWGGNCIDENTGEPELSASKRYEVSILDGVGYINES